MAADISNFLKLVAGEHQDKPDFIAFISIFLQGMADAIQVAAQLPARFDVDFAIGDQLDKTGQWIGRTRYLATPLEVYFSFDTPGLGFDQGVWMGPFDPASGLVKLDDTSYRTLLYAVAAANQWDGTIPGAYAALNTLFAPLGFTFIIQDYGNMSMLFGLIGPNLNALVQALFTTGELDLKPAGVQVTHLIQSISGSTPYFGFDIESAAIAGFDMGAWGTLFFPE